MSNTMQAAVYRSFGGPIQVELVAKPRVPEDGVVIQVMATGVCRSDWHGWKGYDEDVRRHGLPFVPGHEVSGRVVEVGPLCSSSIRIGDRVALPFNLSCGTCSECNLGRPTVCLRQEQPGFTYWGSFAEYMAVPRADRNVSVLPDSVSYVQAAALGCRMTTAYRAVVQQGRFQAGQSVAVFGCGGLGLSCILWLAATLRQSSTIDKELSSIIIAVDVSPEALRKAKELGATHTLCLKEKTEEVWKQVQHMTGGHGVSLSIDAAGFASTSEQAVKSTRRAGRMVQVGLPHESPRIPMATVAAKEIEIVGSHGFAATDLPILLEKVASGEIDPTQLVERQVTLRQGAHSIQDMDHGSPLGMIMVTDFQRPMQQFSSRL